MLENKQRDLRLSCDMAIVYFQTVISMVLNHLENGITNGVLICVNLLL